MDPITMMALSQLIPMGVKLGKSAIQGNQAKKLAETPRPEYQIPEEVMQSLNQAKILASMRELPGQNLMEDKIGQNISKGVSELERVSSNPSQLSSNVAKMFMGGNDQLNNIGVQAAQQWLQNQGMLGNALNNVGTFRDKEFDYNKNQPYQNNMAAAAALREGSFRNFNEGMEDMSSAIGGYANMKYYQDMLGGVTKENNLLKADKDINARIGSIPSVNENSLGKYRPTLNKPKLYPFITE